MDPLSITASIVTFIDIAKRIKSSVDKISQNRRTLKELTSNIVHELTEMQKLCQRREGVLDGSRLDYDLTLSLEDLQSELTDVLARCLKILEPRKQTRFRTVKSGFIAWIKNAEIEADISRLKDHVTSFHRRFTYITSMRMENSLLVVNAENRARMNRMEGLVSRLLIDSHISGIRPPLFLDRASPDGIEFQFLRLQIQKIVDNLSFISASHTLAVDDFEGSYTRPGHQSSEIIQLLESKPSSLSIPDGAEQLLDLGNYLWDLGLGDDAAAIDTWAITIYRTLMLGNNTAFMPYVAWGLLNLASFRSGTQDGLNASKSAVSMYKAMVDTITTFDYSSHLPRAMRNHSVELFLNGLYDDSVESAKEALALQRKVSDSTPLYDTWIQWEASGEEIVVFSSARHFQRSQNMAFEEGMCLQQLACSLAMVGRYNEALIAGNEAFNCYQALVANCPGHGAYDGRLRTLVNPALDGSSSSVPQVTQVLSLLSTIRAPRTAR
ncbi:Tetratricopeptide repeat family [Salix suchowensis]|nr:Tetratricopeptide repeat family [Salix suchowensis]